MFSANHLFHCAPLIPIFSQNDLSRAQCLSSLSLSLSVSLLLFIYRYRYLSPSKLYFLNEGSLLRSLSPGACTIAVSAVASGAPGFRVHIQQRRGDVCFLVDLIVPDWPDFRYTPTLESTLVAWGWDRLIQKLPEFPSHGVCVGLTATFKSKDGPQLTEGCSCS